VTHTELRIPDELDTDLRAVVAVLRRHGIQLPVARDASDPVRYKMASFNSLVTVALGFYLRGLRAKAKERYPAPGILASVQEAMKL